MKFHWQIKINGQWIDCSRDEFDSFKCDKRYGAPGRETYVNPDGKAFSPWLMTAKLLCDYAGRTIH